MARMVGLAVYAFALGTLVWRRRTGADIESDAVDGAAAVRIVFDVIAGVLALATLIAPTQRPLFDRTRARPALLLYSGYTLVVLIAASLAVEPGIVLFRAFEFAIIVLIGLAVVRRLDPPQIMTIVRRMLLLFVILIAFGAIVNPSGAFWMTGGIIPFRLEGGYPLFSANSVGTIGTLLFAIGLSRRSRFDITLGLALTLLAQYRTGYVIAAVTVAVWLLFRKGVANKLAFFILIPAAIALVSTDLFANAWNRGEQSVESLSGRTDIWATVFMVAERSPWLGTGLSSGFRFEVVPQLPAWFSNSSLGSAHNTWVEAYLGVGFIGLGFLASYALYALVASFRARDVLIAPFLIVVATLIRTMTGSTFDIPGWYALMFLILTIAACLARPVSAHMRDARQSFREAHQ